MIRIGVFLAIIYLFKVTIKKLKRYGICSKLIIKTSEWRQYPKMASAPCHLCESQKSISSHLSSRDVADQRIL